MLTTDPVALTVDQDRDCTLARARSRALFTQLPDVLVQDPARDCCYLIPAAELARFETGPETWAGVDGGTVTFVIPGGDTIEEMPPFRQVADLEPSVLIQHRAGEKSYHLDFTALQAYRINGPGVGLNYGISFVIPQSTELFEELPSLRASLLQTQESGQVRFERA